MTVQPSKIAPTLKSGKSDELKTRVKALKAYLTLIAASLVIPLYSTFLSYLFTFWLACVLSRHTQRAATKTAAAGISSSDVLHRESFVLSQQKSPEVFAKASDRGVRPVIPSVQVARLPISPPPS